MILFLDIDGVMNAHEKYENGFCGIGRTQVFMLNHILRECPDLKVVISSAWRYMITRGDMTLQGFEYMLITHGVNIQNRIIGHTAEDLSPEEPREVQIKQYVEKNNIKHYVVLDDLNLLNLENFVKCDPKRGLTGDLAKKVLDGTLQSRLLQSGKGSVTGSAVLP